MKTQKPFNSADFICAMFMQGKAQPGDTLELIRLKLHGIEPVYYNVDGVSITRRTKEDADAATLLHRSQGD